jgi:tetratricopeptide (TPR) repeat protein
MPRASSTVSEPVAAPPAAPAAPLPIVPADPQDAVGKAKLLFRLGRYEDSLASLEQTPEEHAAGADLLAAQALFALADYPTAVEALRRATETLPETAWGRYIADYRSYFPSALRYVVHLRSLERFVDQFPERTEPRLLLAYHYGSLGFFDQAIALLDELKPDPLVNRLRDSFNRQRAAPAPGDDAGGPLLVAPIPLAEHPAKTNRPGPREF